MCAYGLLGFRNANLRFDIFRCFAAEQIHILDGSTVYKSHDTCSKSAINKSFSSSFGCDQVILLCAELLSSSFSSRSAASSSFCFFFKLHATHVIKVFVSLIALAEVPSVQTFCMALPFENETNARDR